jgi:hypothetical protein
MNNNKKLFIVLFYLVIIATHAQEFKTPIEYLNFIGKEQMTISKNVWKYTKSVAHSKSARKIDATRTNLIKSIQTAKTKISGLKNGYNGDVEYRDLIVNYLTNSEYILKEDYGKLIDLQEVSDQSYDFMEAYLMTKDLVDKKMESEQDKVTLGQNQFAQKYSITISETEDELSKKMKISNEVFDSREELFLIFFKCNITDAMMLKAIERKDYAAIQQNANSLEAYANEGLEKLKTIKGYKGDTSLINSTKKSMEFYKKYSKDFSAKVIDFYMFNTKFEDAKTTLESKNQKDRSKEEIENYNEMVKEMNIKINEYNAVSQKSNIERTNIINGWNNSSEVFLAKHVPND